MSERGKQVYDTVRWKRLRASILAESDVCWLCGRPGADSVDHLVALKDGGDPYARSNLAPAHGRKQPWGCPGNYGRSGRKDAAALPPKTSRAW